MTMYRIKRSDGLYSRGGAYPHFSKRGKVWASIHDLRRHLGIVSDARQIERYVDCAVEVWHIGPENWEIDPLAHYLPAGGWRVPTMNAEELVKSAGGSIEQLHAINDEARRYVLGRLLEKHVRTKHKGDVSVLVEPDRWLLVGNVQGKPVLIVLRDGNTQFDIEALQGAMGECDREFARESEGGEP